MVAEPDVHAVIADGMAVFSVHQPDYDFVVLRGRQHSGEEKHCNGENEFLHALGPRRNVAFDSPRLFPGCR